MARIILIWKYCNRWLLDVFMKISFGINVSKKQKYFWSKQIYRWLYHCSCQKSLCSSLNLKFIHSSCKGLLEGTKYSTHYKYGSHLQERSFVSEFFIIFLLNRIACLNGNTRYKVSEHPFLFSCAAYDSCIRHFVCIVKVNFFCTVTSLSIFLPSQ